MNQAEATQIQEIGLGTILSRRKIKVAWRNQPDPRVVRFGSDNIAYALPIDCATVVKICANGYRVKTPDGSIYNVSEYAIESGEWGL